MATSKTYLARPTYRFLPNDHAIPLNRHDSFELDESDLYNSVRSNSPEFHKPSNTTTTTTNQSRWKSSKRSSDSGEKAVSAAGPSSLPVNIPDWSRILGGEYRENNRWRDGFEDIDDDDDDRNEDACGGEARVVPPHEFLARTRIASFSVHEGRGRTLKGRDLSRVRNAIWQKTGFED